MTDAPPFPDSAWYVATAVAVVLAILATAMLGTVHGPENAGILLYWSLVLLAGGFLVQRGLRRAYNYMHAVGKG